MIFTKDNRVLKYSIFTIFFMCLACEDTVHIDLDSPEGKLVVDAEIIWYKGTDGHHQTIKLSRMTDYYAPETPKVSEAEIYLENSSGDSFPFEESSTAGYYVCDNFVPELNETYTLHLSVENQTYTASETLVPVPDINRIEQALVESFSGDHNIEVSFFYDDPPDQKDYYLADFKTDILPHPDYVLTNDDFYDGNEIKTAFSDEDLTVGDTIEITHRGISKQFYKYMELALEATSPNPFGTSPANIKGNVVNISDPDDEVLGYFRILQADHLTYSVQEMP